MVAVCPRLAIVDTTSQAFQCNTPKAKPNASEVRLETHLEGNSFPDEGMRGSTRVWSGVHCLFSITRLHTLKLRISSYWLYIQSPKLTGMGGALGESEKSE